MEILAIILAGFVALLLLDALAIGFGQDSRDMLDNEDGDRQATLSHRAI
jgi:hypothetical protein